VKPCAPYLERLEKVERHEQGEGHHRWGELQGFPLPTQRRERQQVDEEEQG
tara:strand:- start:596 stop:748 length:153 start_codon:yes stop_codon:yes gene_type:complete